MIALGGMIFILICVFVVYMLTGGSMHVVLHALPHEMSTIGGAAVGTFLIANSVHTIKHTLKDLKKVFKGARYHKKEYVELLCLLFQMLKTIRTKGALAIEVHIENPKESSLFQNYPKILANHFLMGLICDYMRMYTMGMEDPHQMEDTMEREIEAYHHDEMHVGHAIQSMADALPALGIVAAVLGVIKTMSSINEPPAVLGGMIGSALVGTFLGVMLAYGFVAPMAARLSSIYAEELKYYKIIQVVIVAHLKGSAPQISIETGRKAIPHEYMPEFKDLEEAMSALPAV